MSNSQRVAGLEEVWKAVGALPAAFPLPAACEERHLPGRGVGWEPNSASEAWVQRGRGAALQETKGVVFWAGLQACVDLAG